MNNKKQILFCFFSLFTLTPAWALNLNVNSVTDDVDASPGDGICATSTGVCTLRAAVQEANATPGIDTLSVAAGVYVLTRGAVGEDVGAEGDLDVADHLIIVGAGNTSTIIDGNGADRVMDLGDGVRLELRDLKIQNGIVPPSYWYGGAVRMLRSNTLIISNVHLSNNQALEGGAIYCMNEGRIEINDSQLDGNHATSGDGSFGAGGAIYAIQRCSIFIANSVFANNSGNTYGGAIQSKEGELLITGSQFIGNTTADDGGAISSGSQTVIVDSTFTGNTAAGSRGAITAGPIKIFNSTFSNNTANYNYCGAFGLSDAYLDGVTVDANIGGGGCLYNSKVVNSVFKNNIFDPTRYSLGGGISGTLVEIRDSAIINNNAVATAQNVTGQGGGLYLSREATVVNTTISGNSANQGGGVHLDTSNGGGIYTFTNVTIADNNATVVGSADNFLASSDSTVTVTFANSIISRATTGVNCSGLIKSAGGNIASDSTCSLGAQDSVANPLLQALDTTKYVLPLSASSPALNGALAAACPGDDQRGYLRTDGSCDSGAYESGATAVATKSLIGITESYTEMPEYGSAFFTLTRGGSSQGEVSVAVTTVSDTARVTEDYTPLSQIVTWAAGDSAPKVIEVPLVTDQAVEEDEEFVLRIAAVSPNGTIDPLKKDGRVHIFDNDGAHGQIAIESTYKKWENRGTLTILVQRQFGSSKDYSVDYRTIDGTALSGVDFNAVSGTLHWADGDSAPKEINIEILNDTLVEGTEQFTVELTNHTRTDGDVTQTATVTIDDDESWAFFDLSSSTFAVAENAGTLAVTVTRSGKTNVQSSVYLFANSGTDGTASSADFTMYYQQIVFAAGEVSKTVNIQILNDTAVELAETFSISLFSPDAATSQLGELVLAVATINDDDSGSTPPPSGGGTTTPAAPSGGGGGFGLEMLLLLVAFRFITPAVSVSWRGMVGR